MEQQLGIVFLSREEPSSTHARDVPLSSHNDHRIAMSMAVATLACKEPVILTGGESVSKSYPEFWRDYASVGGMAEKIN